MLQQRQVGMLFGLFVRTIGAARFVCAVAPVAALVAAASIPLPRVASPIDVSMPSSGLVQMLAVAQNAVGATQSSFAFHERRRHPAMHAEEAQASDAHGNGSPASRIGDRFLQLRAAQRAMQRTDEASSRHVGERLLHVASSHPFDTWAAASTVPAVAFLSDVLKPVAATGAEPRAPPDAARSPKEAGDPQPASTHQFAQASQQHTGGAQPPVVSGPESAARPKAEEKRVERDSFSPLKLSPEQRNISRFVARRYRVNLDDVQRFVAHAYRAATEFRLDPYLVLAVMSIESSFNPNARSSAGAQGLMQVLTRVHLDKFEPFGGARAALDPVANITVGSRILKEYLVREGSVEGALKSYVGAALLPHDFGYGRKVLTERARIAAAALADDAPSITASVSSATKIAMAEPQPQQRSSPKAGDVAVAPDATSAARRQAQSSVPAMRVPERNAPILRTVANDAPVVSNEARAVSNEARAVSNEASAVSNEASAVSNDARAVSNRTRAVSNEARAASGDAPASSSDAPVSSNDASSNGAPVSSTQAPASLPTQVNEPRASSNTVLVPSGASREL